MPALVAVAWLVPGTALLLAGRLLPLPLVIIFAALAVALCYLALRRLPAGWPRFGGTRRVSAVAVLLMAAVPVGFGVWQALYRAEPVFANGDASGYLQYGYWIAKHGTVRIPTSAAAFGGVPGLSFASSGFSVSGGFLTPSLAPGLPLVLAGGTWLDGLGWLGGHGGLGAALLMPALLGGCALLSFGGLVGRLCGVWWAVAAELVLAVCLPEIYVARTPMSEPLVQVLLFGGLCLFIDSQVPSRVGSGSRLVLAGLGGLALGLTTLGSIGSLGLLLPAFLVLAMLFVSRRAQAVPFALGLFAGIGLGLAAGLVLSRAYLSSLSPQLHLIGYSVAGFGVTTLLLAPFAFTGVRAWALRVSARRPRLWRIPLPSLGAVLVGVAVAVPVLALAGLAGRPYVQTVHGQTNPAMIRAVASLQHLERLPVAGTRTYAESSLYWVFWYLGVPAVLLACAGAAVLGRRLVRVVLLPPASAATSGSAAVSDVSAAAAARLWALPLLLIGWSTAAVLWDPSVVPWQPLAAHRLVPVVLPGLLLLAVWMASRLTSWAAEMGAHRVIVALVVMCSVFALGIPPLVTTFNPGVAAKSSVGQSSSRLAALVSRVRLRGVGAQATYGGSLGAAGSLCAKIGPSASVVFVDAATATSYAPVVRGLCDTPTATVSPRSALGQAVHAIAKAGRRPVVLGPSQPSVALPGLVSHRVISMTTPADAQVLTGPPAGNWSATYTLWLAAPAS